MEELTKITQEELNQLLDKHNKWLDGDIYGECLALYDFDFSNLDFSNSDLRRIVLICCDLVNVNFTNADLECASLISSDLTNINFTNTNLINASLEDSIIPDTTNFTNTKGVEQICPTKGKFIGYKKCKGSRIVELLIPADALRSNGASRKCRCSKAKVLSITNIDKNKEYDVARSKWSSNFIYKVGETVEVKDFDTNRFNQCTTGIHFFMTRDEVVKY